MIKPIINTFFNKKEDPNKPEHFPDGLTSILKSKNLFERTGVKTNLDYPINFIGKTLQKEETKIIHKKTQKVWATTIPDIFNEDRGSYEFKLTEDGKKGIKEANKKYENWEKDKNSRILPSLKRTVVKNANSLKKTLNQLKPRKSKPTYKKNAIDTVEKSERKFRQDKQISS